MRSVFTHSPLSTVYSRGPRHPAPRMTLRSPWQGGWPTCEILQNAGSFHCLTLRITPPRYTSLRSEACDDTSCVKYRRPKNSGQLTDDQPPCQCNAHHHPEDVERSLPSRREKVGGGRRMRWHTAGLMCSGPSCDVGTVPQGPKPDAATLRYPFQSQRHSLTLARVYELVLVDRGTIVIAIVKHIRVQIRCRNTDTR